MRHVHSLLAAVLFTSCAASSAAAWSARTHENVAEQAGRLMPPSLRKVLASHRGRLKEGAATAHLPANLESGGACALDKAVVVQSQRVLDLLRERTSLSAVAYEMGVLSHLVALAEDPTHGPDRTGNEELWSSDFRTFVAERTDRFKVVFDGYLAEPLERDDVAAFVRGLCARSERYHPVLAGSYVREGGGLADSRSFDDRHPVFGVAELSYAHAISDTAKIWLYIWIQAGGDASGLPYPDALQPSRAAGASRP